MHWHRYSSPNCTSKKLTGLASLCVCVCVHSNGFQLLVAEQRVASGPMAPRDHLRASSLRWRSLRQAERDGYNTRANGVCTRTH